MKILEKDKCVLLQQPMITRERAKYVSRNYHLQLATYPRSKDIWTKEDMDFLQYFKEACALNPIKVGENSRPTHDKIIDEYTQLRRDKILNEILS